MVFDVIKNIKILQKHIDKRDVWIIGAGSSLNFISNNFFRNKVTIGINNATCKFSCDFIITKEPEELFENKPNDSNIIISKYKYGMTDQKENPYKKNNIVFDHPHNEGKIKLDTIDVDEDYVAVSHSTLSSAIHIAAIAGASNIILCGCENESRNGNLYMDGYQISKNKNCSFQSLSDWMSSENVNLDISDLIKKIIGVYEIDIHILEPWTVLDKKDFNTSVDCEFDNPNNNKVFPH